MDTQTLKTRSDLLTLVQADTVLKKAAGTGGGEWAGPCPFCGGRDRFRIQPYHDAGARWFCRGCGEGRWQDVIAYVMRRDSLDFKEACRVLGGENGHTRPTTRLKRPAPRPNPEKKEAPARTWRDRALQFIEEAEAELWKDTGERARQWLRARGLTDETIKKYRLGYAAGDRWDLPGLWGQERKNNIWLPRGIVVPGLIEGIPWYVKIRRSDADLKTKNDPKYPQIRGSKSGAALYGADNLNLAERVLLVEGEFDTMLADQELGDLCGVATFGSASAYNRPLDLVTWGRYLIPARSILAALDVDEDGQKAREKLTLQSAKIQDARVPVLRPGDNDLTDYHLAGGDLRGWFIGHLLSGDDFDAWDERVAIMTVDGGMSRQEAERAALQRVIS